MSIDSSWVRVSVDRIVVAAADLLEARETYAETDVGLADVEGDAGDLAAVEEALLELTDALTFRELERAAVDHLVAWGYCSAGSRSRILLESTRPDSHAADLEELGRMGALLRDPEVTDRTRMAVSPLIWAVAGAVARTAYVHTGRLLSWGLSNALTEASPTGELCWQQAPGLAVRRPLRFHLRSFTSGNRCFVYGNHDSSDPRFDGITPAYELPVPLTLAEVS